MSVQIAIIGVYIAQCRPMGARMPRWVSAAAAHDASVHEHDLGAAVLALHFQAHGGARFAADALYRVSEAEVGGGLAIDGEDHVALAEPRLRGSAAADQLLDLEGAVVVAR